MRLPRRFGELPYGCAGTSFIGTGFIRANLDYIHDRVPLAIELASLLGSDFEQQGDYVILPSVLGVHRRQIKTSAGNRVEDAHQCALRVAIADVKDLHGRSPQTKLSH